MAERARRAAAYKPRSGGYERNRFPFSSKVRCGKCGKYFTRKTAAAKTPYEKQVWICRTFNQKGKAHCDAKQIPEEILKRVSAEAMGLPNLTRRLLQPRWKKFRCRRMACWSLFSMTGIP